MNYHENLEDLQNHQSIGHTCKVDHLCSTLLHLLLLYVLPPEGLYLKSRQGQQNATCPWAGSCPTGRWCYRGCYWAVDKIGIRTTDEGIISVSHWGLPRWLSGKEFACQCRRHRRLGFDTWVGEIPLRRTQQPPPVPGKSHRHWSLVGYSLRGYRVRHDLATEHTHVHQHYIYWLC